jgi:hypothetical protein
MNGAFPQQDKLGQMRPSPMPTPNMQQAGKPPQQQPSPFPQSGFAKQGAVAKPAMPSPMGNPMDEQ